MPRGLGQAAGLERGCAERDREAAGAGAPRLRGACWRRLGPGPRPRRPRCGRSGLAAGSVSSDGGAAPAAPGLGVAAPAAAADWDSCLQRQPRGRRRGSRGPGTPGTRARGRGR